MHMLLSYYRKGLGSNLDGDNARDLFRNSSVPSAIHYLLFILSFDLEFAVLPKGELIGQKS
jgi:hypothetical protein